MLFKPHFAAQFVQLELYLNDALLLDLNINAGGELETHQRVHHGGRRIDDIYQTLVCSHLKLLASLFVDMG